MQINWFTFVAQIVNFLILVFLLKHFLFNRILKRMDERSHRIQNQLESAKKETEEANQRKQALNEEYQKLESQKESFLKKASEDVDEQKQEMLVKARQDVDNRYELWLSALENEQQSLLEGFEKKVRQYMFQISDELLSSLADTSLQKQMINRFIDYYRQLPDEQKNFLKQYVLENNKLTVETAMPLGPDLQKQLSELLPASNEQLDFQTRTDMIAGVRLRVNGYKMDWNIQGSLQELDASFLEELRHHSRERKQNMEALHKQNMKNK